MKSRVIKKINLSLFLVVMACGQQLSAESHYVAPRYAQPSFAPDVESEQNSVQEDSQDQEQKTVSAQTDSVSDAQLVFPGLDIKDLAEEEVLESRVNVPGDED